MTSYELVIALSFFWKYVIINKSGKATFSIIIEVNFIRLA